MGWIILQYELTKLFKRDLGEDHNKLCLTFFSFMDAKNV